MFAISIVWWECVVSKNMVSYNVLNALPGRKNESRSCVVFV